MIAGPASVILTAAEMHAAEQAMIAGSVSAATLMDRAGRGVAEQVRRLAAGHEILILSGPGNNGGDGYVAAAALARSGARVRVAASSIPTTAEAKAARDEWGRAVEDVVTAAPAPVIVDALFGTGLTRPLDPRLAARLCALASPARLTIGVDLPSGVKADDGAVLGQVPECDVTLALGAAKPSHFLQPAARYCGAVRVIDIGVPVDSRLSLLACPVLPQPGPDDHKYRRGMVAIVAGDMPGAAALAGIAAFRSGAGYITLLGDKSLLGPAALVHRPLDADALGDDRIGAVVIGPGLGRTSVASRRLNEVVVSPHRLVIDGDALHLLAGRDHDFTARQAPVILTPHAGEFAALFGNAGGDKVARARAAAAATGATIVFKGSDTVIAAPDGRAVIAGEASPWLSTAGTGDVLAGAIAAMLAAGMTPFDAASAGVWLHAAAARRLGASFIADDLARAMSGARTR